MISNKQLFIADNKSKVVEKSIYIAYNGNDNYVNQLVVSMTSVVINLSKEYKAHFILLMTDLSDESKNKFQKFQTIYDCDIEFYDITKYEILDKIIFNGYLNKSTTLRLTLFDSLPDSIHHCYYIDGDMIVDFDIAELEDKVSSDDYLMAAVVDYLVLRDGPRIHPHVFDKKLFPSFVKDKKRYPYYNSGFFVINNLESKKMNLWQHICEVIDEGKILPYPDQDIINMVITQKYPDKIMVLSPRYNMVCFDIDFDEIYERCYYSKEEFRDSVKSIKIYHYLGNYKPWDGHSYKYYEVWWKYCALSIVKEEFMIKIANNYSELTKKTKSVKSCIKLIFDNIFKMIKK